MSAVIGDAPSHGSSEDYVYEWLKNAITSGAIGPGERIVETTVARRLSVSRTPVRAAIKLLEDQRLLTRKAGAGIVVRELTPDELDDIYVTRAVLMGLAARLAAQRMAPHVLARLRALQDEIENLTQEESFRRLALVNEEFHDTIVAASRNDILRAILDEIHLSTIRYTNPSLQISGRATEALSEHRELIAALAQRDAEGAEILARTHVMNAHSARLRQQAELAVGGYKTAEPRTRA